MELDGVPVSPEVVAALALVGFGHFTSMRVEDGGVRGLSLHLDRLLRDCREVFMVDLDADRVRALVRRALIGVGVPVVARVTVFDPALETSRPGQPAQPHILVTLRAAPTLPQQPLRLQSVVYSRDLPAIKHVGLFGALHHRARAQRAGFDDVLFIEPDGSTTEIATSNIGFITEDGRLIWPDADVLPGTTMHLLEQVWDGGPATRKVTLADLGQFACLVATNAAGGVRAVRQIDAMQWPGEHAILDLLQDEYNSIPPQRI